MKTALAFTLLSVLFASGVVISEDREAQIREIGDRAASALFGQLMGRLTAVTAEEGLAAAVAVCRSEAPQIAARVASEFAGEGVVEVRRIGVRTRNPNHAPDEDDQKALETLESQREPFFKIARSATDSPELRYYRPIPTAVSCLACHGPQDAIAPEIAASIAAHYPNDAATGFAEGDLRGAIVISFSDLPTESDTTP